MSSLPTSKSVTKPAAILEDEEFNKKGTQILLEGDKSLHDVHADKTYRRRQSLQRLSMPVRSLARSSTQKPADATTSHVVGWADEQGALQAMDQADDEIAQILLIADSVQKFQQHNADHLKNSAFKLRSTIELCKNLQLQQRDIMRDPLVHERLLVRQMGYNRIKPIKLDRRSALSFTDTTTPQKKTTWQKWRPRLTLSAIIFILLLIFIVFPIIISKGNRIPGEGGSPYDHVYAISEESPYHQLLDSKPLNMVEVHIKSPAWNHHRAQIKIYDAEDQIHIAENGDGDHRRMLLASSGGDSPVTPPTLEISLMQHTEKEFDDQPKQDAAGKSLKRRLQNIGGRLLRVENSRDTPYQFDQDVKNWSHRDILDVAENGQVSLSNWSDQKDNYKAVTKPQTCVLDDQDLVGCFPEFLKNDYTDDYTEGEPVFIHINIVNNTDKHLYTVPASVHVFQFGALGKAKVWLALTILLVVLITVAMELIHRTLAAMIGSFVVMGLLVLTDQVPDLQVVIEWIDEGSLALLFGMMIMIAKLSTTGFFEVATVHVVRRCRGSLAVLVILMCSLTAVLSAFLDNVTTLLLIGPVTIQMARRLDIDPAPLLICETLFSNIGGTATMIGDPPNIIIGNKLPELGFLKFITVLGPGVLIMSGPCMLLLFYLYGNKVRGRLENYEQVCGRVNTVAAEKAEQGKATEAPVEYKIKDMYLLRLTLSVLGLVIVSFLLHPVLHVNPAWIALMGAVVLMVLTSTHSIHHDLEAVEWDTLIFFAALFVMVEGMAEVGLIRKIGTTLENIIGSVGEGQRERVAIVTITFVSAIVSAFLDNIPYTATMVPVVKQLSGGKLGLELEPLAWSLAFGACLGGNGSLVGASANVVMVGIAEREKLHISFFDFTKKGFPIMLLSVAIAVVYLLLRFAI